MVYFLILQIAERISEQYLRCQQGKLAEVREQTAKLAEKKVTKRATVTAAPTPGEEEDGSDEDETEVGFFSHQNITGLDEQNDASTSELFHEINSSTI